MKRFYTEAAAVPAGAAWAITLDGRPVKTPARQPLHLPNVRLAEDVAAEWRAQGETIDPRSMPLTGLANAAIDRVTPAKDSFAADLARYGETDLLCYRAADPAELVERQAREWDPLLGWARKRYDVAFEVVVGVMHRPQPPATVSRLGDAITCRPPFVLAAFSPLVTISGSLVIALALNEGAIDAETAFATAHLDELWQAQHWGEDDLATRAREARRHDFLAAARFLEILDGG